LRIKIDLESLSTVGLVLPRHHNYLIQGFIYRNLSKAIATKVHDQGYKYGKREFRLFTFSRLFGRFESRDRNLTFKEKCTLWIASPITEILESLACSLARKGKMKIGNNYCRVLSIEVPFTGDYNKELLIRALSPITVYSTLFTQDKKKKTYYYSPFEDNFSRLLKENLLKKYVLINNGEPEGELDFSITPEKVSKRNEHIIFYKETVIKAWSGIYRLKGSIELIKLAFDCGLGAKNSQGFGMIEQWNRNRRDNRASRARYEPQR